MRYLKTYRVFESAGSGLTKKQEEFLAKHTKGSWKHDPATGLVDVQGDFTFSIMDRMVDMYGIKFGKVSGNFDCSWNKLTSLEGSPQKVGGSFDCRHNNLTSLKGAPQEVGGSFDCRGNRHSEGKLYSLEGAPQKVGGDFYCSSNRLTSLKGAPQEVGGDFNCEESNLTSLKGAPREVGGGFNCSENKLTTLEGAPQKIGGYFDCTSNKLTSLKGAPQKVGGYFKCSSNDLTSLEGAPQKVGGYFNCGFFKLPRGKWNLKGWLAVLEIGRPNAQSLILPFISPEAINKEIQKDPAGMIMKLKHFWNDERFKETRSRLVWPEGYGGEMEIVGGLNTIGF